MNKKDLSQIRKEFKAEGYKINYGAITNVYLKKRDMGAEVIGKESRLFSALDETKKELYYTNFKKVLSGAIDTKVFDLGFVDTENEDNTQKILYSALNGTNSDENFDKLIKKLCDNYIYDNDVVVTMLKADYIGSSNKKNQDDEDDGISIKMSFILCSINKVEFSETALKFDFINKTFDTNSSLDSTINLKSPADGFMFPLYVDGYGDVNKILYYSSKAKDVEKKTLVENVLSCEFKYTAEAEKDCFNSVLKLAIGDKISSSAMQTVYEKINEFKETADEGSVPTVDARTLEKIVVESGINLKQPIHAALEEVMYKSQHDFKISNIIPDIDAKSLKLSNEKTSITIAPKDLNSIRQIRDKNGKKCLLIEISDDVTINGFTLETEDSIDETSL